MEDFVGYIIALARIQEIDKELSRSVKWENWSHNQKIDRLVAEQEYLLDKYHICEHGFEIGRPATINITINL